MEKFDIVSILKVGLSGLVFLLAAMGYKLLSQEQKKDKSDLNTLSAIFRFMKYAIVLAILVGLFSLVELKLKPKKIGEIADEAKNCRSKLELLLAQTDSESANVNTLKNVIRANTEQCISFLEGLHD